MKHLLILISIVSSLSNSLPLFGGENSEKTPKLEEINPLSDQTPVLEKTKPKFQEKIRKANPSGKNLKSVRDSSGEIVPLKEAESLWKGREISTLKEPPKYRKPLDFRRKDKSDYVY
jgi:hypothetical protein